MTDDMNEIGIRIVRLTSGEEVLCKLHEDETNYTLKKPHILLPQGEGRLAIAPWCPYADIGTSGVTLGKEHVMFVVRAGADMEGQYKEMTTGLVMPPAGMDASKLKLTT
jgi:hypothetical protein